MSRSTTSANRGGTLPNTEAIGKDHESQYNYNTDTAPIANCTILRRIPRSFWEIYLKQSKAPKAAALPDNSPVEELAYTPGAGSLVTITDPEHHQEPINPPGEQPPQKKIILNFPSEKLHIRKFNRFEPGSALDHFGLSTQNFESQLQFYTSTFNIVPTDFVYIEQDSQRIPITVFIHLDLVKEPVDHHAFFLGANSKKSLVHHCSFEGYPPAWGVGRHVLGSQILDYWWDISGNIVEHYADGDLVNAETPIGYVPAGPDSLAIWGPRVPAAYLE
ncbi:hypothetical protein VI817_009015 [Penicillium citrinum]|nr:hypothetical protein VI817_009015 [Penicillium citrinum]